MIEISGWVIGTILSLIGLLFTGFGFFYARQKSAIDVAQERGVVLTELKNLDKKVDGILSSQSSQTSQCKTHGERMAVAEQSVKSAHHRIDGLEQTIRDLPRGSL